MPRKNTQLALIETEAQEEKQQLKAWALIELFGHARVVGLMTVDPPEFPGMIRVDVPDLLKDGKVIREGGTRYIGRAALYGVTPVTEQAVRELLPHVDGKPHRPMSFGRDEF
jgi:hypothetical protein